MAYHETIAALNLLSAEEFCLSKKTYQRTSFEEMRANVISRARETLDVSAGSLFW